MRQQRNSIRKTMNMLRLSRLAAPAVVTVAAVVAATTAQASFNPDLTLTQAAYDTCLAQAHDPASQITVTDGQSTLVGPTSDLSAVYAALAGTASAASVAVTSNAAGDQALGAAQSCLARTVPTIGAARLHQVRADLRCGTHLLVDEQTSFNTFITVDSPWVTFLPDGVQNPVCDDKIHRLTHALDNGDRAGVHLTNNNNNKAERNALDVTCKNNGDCDNAFTNVCRVSDEADGLPIRCMCGDVGPPGNGCLGDSSTKVQSVGSACASSVF